VRGLAALLLTAGAALAEAPPPEYFTGVYERIGRDGSGRMVNDVVRIDPGEGGLVLRVCGAGAGQVPERLAFDTFGDVQNLLTGDGLWCLFSNNGDNYPLLNCAGDGAARATLWPEPDLPCAP
jgi:hypothetical protein